MGGGGTTTLAVPSQSSTSVDYPQWFKDAGEDVYNRAKGVSEKAFPSYAPADRVAGLTPDHQAAFEGVRSGTGSWRPAYGLASDYAAQSVGPNAMRSRAGALADPTSQDTSFYGRAMGQADRRLDTATGAQRTYGPGGQVTTSFEQYTPENMEKFMNPYTKGVLGEAEGEFLRSRGIQRKDISDAAQRAGAFGGARHGIVESEFDRDTREGVQDIWTRGMDQAFRNAQAQREAERGALFTEEGLGLQGAGALAQIGSDQIANQLRSGALLGQLGQEEVGNLQSAADLMSRLGTTQQALEYGDTDALRTIGDIQRDYDQALSNAGYQEFLREEQYPYDQVGWLAGILGGTQVPRTSSTQSVQNQVIQNPSLAGQLIGGGVSLLGGLTSGIFSSEEYKTDKRKPALSTEPAKKATKGALPAAGGSPSLDVRALTPSVGMPRTDKSGALSSNTPLSAYVDPSLLPRERQSPSGALSGLRETPVYDYKYKEGAKGALGAPGGRRIGPMAEDYSRTMGGDGKTVDVGNAIGSLMLAVQELDRRTGAR